jgi:hypothetical protein
VSGPPTSLVVLLVTRRSRFFSRLLALAALGLALFSASVASADDDDEPYMNAFAASGWTHSARGASVPIGYNIGFSFSEHLYTGMFFAATLGPSEGIGIDATGKPAHALDVGILVGTDFGYEQVIGDSAIVRGTLGLGGYFWSRQQKPDDVEDRIRANGFVVVPSVLIGGLAGPVLLGIETRGLLGTIPTDRWSYGALFVIGSRFEMK